MKSDKKAGVVFGISYLVLAFMLLITTSFFYAIFLYQIGGDEIIDPTTNLTLEAGSNANISSEMNTAILGYQQSYRDNEPAWDVFFIVTFIIFFISSLIISMLSKKESALGFFSLVTIGMMIFLLVFTFIDQITTYLFDNLIVGMLEFDLSQTPFINFYYANIQLVSFFWVLLIFIVNQFDIDVLARQKGRVQP